MGLHLICYMFYIGRELMVLMLRPQRSMYTLVSTPLLYYMTLHSLNFQLLSHILVSIIHQFPLCCCVCSAASCVRCSTLWLLHILAVDTHMIDYVTHNYKVITTKGGQQTGPTLTINHLGGGCFS
jgi:hypothetical protein